MVQDRTMADVDPGSDTRSGHLDRAGAHGVTLVIYSTITLLSVVVATTAKLYVDSYYELVIVAFGTCVGLVIAHAWAGMISRVLVHKEQLGSGILFEEVRSASWSFIPGVLLAVLLPVEAIFGVSFELAATWAILALTVLLFVSGYFAALGIRHSKAAAWAWGGGSAAVGVLAVILKLAIS